jgi:hypothetical protein
LGEADFPDTIRASTSTLSMWMNPGGTIPNERVLKSMRLFAERVAPRLI